MKTVKRADVLAEPVPVVLVEDHESIREMMRVVLEREGGYEIVGEAGNGVEGLRLCRARRPGIVVLDLSLPMLSGAHVLRLLRGEPWDARVVVYTGVMDGALMREALREEPHGFVLKEDPLAELHAALRAAARGARHISPWVSRVTSALEVDLLGKLTATERAVLEMLAGGMQTKEVAEALGASAKTVENHRHHIREKLGVHDAVSLARLAIRHGMAKV